MKATVSALPFGDVTLNLKVTTYNASVKDAVNPSANITVVDSGKSVAFSTAAGSGYLMFKCGVKIGSSSTLTYSLTGTDVKSFSLSSTTVSVSSVAATKELTTATVTWAMNADVSTTPSTTMTGKCPDIGMAYAWFAPVKTPAFTAPSKATAEASANAAIKARLADPNFNGAGVEQYCKVAVPTTDTAVTCAFNTVSNTNYTTMLFCESTSGWKYATAKPVTVLSKTNGGKVVALEFTFAKAINAITDNPTVLKMCCAIV